MSVGPLRPSGRIERGSGRTRVFCEGFLRGDDLLVVLGGEGPHLGAVSLAEPRGDDGTVRCGTLGALGHREPDLTADLARRLASATGRRVVLTGGIHLDDATPEEIEGVLANARSAIEAVAGTLNRRQEGWPGTDGAPG